MKKIFLSLLLMLPRLSWWCISILFALGSDSKAFTGSLVEEWGWLPERAGIIAAESWGIKPQWQGKTLVESYLVQHSAAKLPLLVRTRMVAAEPLPNLPAPVEVPVTPAGFCEIIGEVSDDKLEPVKGAVVEILGTGKTAETSADGSFSFTAVASGNLILEAAKLGYSSDTQSATAIPGQKLTIRLVLKVKAADGATDETMLEEETVVGEYQENNAGDFNMELVTDSPNIIAGLNKDDLSRTGSGDAGAAVSKIAGANIVGGRYAVVRGLGDRYSNTLFNGALIPSADPTKKAVQLDLFPTDLLESVAITKLFLPELPAEFAGGTVQIQTLRMPKSPIVEFSMGTKWFEQRPGGQFLGDPNTKIGLRDMDYSEMPSRFVNPNGFTGSVSDSMEMHLSAPMRPSAVNEEQARSMSTVVGNTYEISEGLRLGAVLALTQSTEQVYQSVNLGRGYRAFGNKPKIDNTRNVEEFDRNLTFGTMSSLSLEMGDKHEVSYTYFLNDSNTDGYARTFNSRSLSSDPLYTANPYDARDPDTGEIIRAYATPVGNSDYFEPLQRSLTANQFNGKHVIYGEKSRGAVLSWMISDATAQEARPHSRTYSATTLDFADENLAELAQFNPSDYRPEFGQYTGAGDPVLISGFPFVNVFRETLTTEDRGGNRRADVTLPFYFDDQTDDHIGLRFGYNTSDRVREVRGRFYSYDFSRINDRLMIENSLGDYQKNYGQLFHDAFNNGTYPETAGTPFFGNQGITINDFSGNGATIRNIDAGSAIDSVYLGGDLALGGWTISGGARIESERRQYQILPTLNPVLIANPKPVVFEYENLLPGVVLTKVMGVDNKHTMTFGWSKTVARPTFYEFAPAFIVDQATGDVTRGNPNLVNSSITNYDLRYDCKITGNTSVGIGLFSKAVENPIVDAFDTVLNAQSWINGDSGTLKGVETEFNTKLGDRYRLSGNYTFIDSNLQYVLQNKQINTGFTGQPEHIFNLIAGYDLEEHGFSANLIYNFTGEFMSQAPTAATAPPIMEESFKTLDFNISKAFEVGNCSGKVTIAARNILDSTRRQYFGGTAFTFREVKPGRIYSLSCELTF